MLISFPTLITENFLSETPIISAIFTRKRPLLLRVVKSSIIMYQKLRINAIKTLRRQNSELSKLTYSISREIYWFGSVLSYLGLENTDLIVESNNESLKGLENLESSTYAFLSMMIDRIDSSEFKFRDSPYNQMKIVERIEFILDLSIKEGLKKFK